MGDLVEFGGMREKGGMRGEGIQMGWGDESGGGGRRKRVSGRGWVGVKVGEARGISVCRRYLA